MLPIFTLFYRLYRFLRKKLELHVFDNGQFANLFTRRWVTNVAVVSLAFLVTATNLYASEGLPSADNPQEQTSILSHLTQDFEEELMVEEADDAAEAHRDVTYLDGQALLQQANHAAPITLQADEAGGFVGELSFAPPVLNAVRTQPESLSQTEAPPTRTQIVDYVITDGDTAEVVARKFGLQLQTILAANGLSSRGLIRIGQKLRILPVDGVAYKIRKGDTLAKIAKTYKSDEATIIEFNGLPSDGKGIAVGLEIVLPGGRQPPPPPAPAPVRLADSLSDIFVPGAADRVGSGQLLWPTAARRITQYYKKRHTGLDIGGPKGTPIYAAEKGTVIFAGWNRGGYGNMVLLDHGGGLYTRYAHATKLLKKAGDAVERGDTIALMGSTGRSTGPHLHFEVMSGSTSRRLNPLDYVK